MQSIDSLQLISYIGLFSFIPLILFFAFLLTHFISRILLYPLRYCWIHIINLNIILNLLMPYLFCQRNTRRGIGRRRRRRQVLLPVLIITSSPSRQSSSRNSVFIRLDLEHVICMWTIWFQGWTFSPVRLGSIQVLHKQIFLNFVQPLM